MKTATGALVLLGLLTACATPDAEERRAANETKVVCSQERATGTLQRRTQCERVSDQERNADGAKAVLESIKPPLPATR